MRIVERPARRAGVVVEVHTTRDELLEALEAFDEGRDADYEDDGRPASIVFVDDERTTE